MRGQKGAFVWLFCWCLVVVSASLNCQPLQPPSLFNFTQELDHNNNNGTFHQRIQVIPVPPSGARAQRNVVLFYAGPENAWVDYTMPCTALFSWASQLGAVALIGAEHRFFGKSWPDNITTPDEYARVMKTLTLDNILADYAAVIRAYTGPASTFYPNARVITFGGSYGGFLSAMMRISYPDLVYGAIASAAPVLLTGAPELANGTWFDTVADIFSTSDPTCAAALSKGMQLVKTLFAQQQFAALKSSLNLCATPTPTSQYRDTLLLMHAASLVPQFNYPFKSADKVPFAFSAVCTAFKNLQPLDGLRNMLDIAYNNSGKLTCFGSSSPASLLSSSSSSALSASHFLLQHARSLDFPAYLPPTSRGIATSSGNLLLSPFVFPIPSSSASFPRSFAGKNLVGDISFEMSWFYITCSFFLMPIAGGERSNTFFGFAPPYNLDAINKYCFDKFGVTGQPTPPINATALSATSRIVFSNMHFDPVKAFSIQQNVSETVVLLMIDNAGHTQDVIAYDTAEQAEVTAARKRETEIMNSWLDAE